MNLVKYHWINAIIIVIIIELLIKVNPVYVTYYAQNITLPILIVGSLIALLFLIDSFYLSSLRDMRNYFQSSYNLINAAFIALFILFLDRFDIWFTGDNPELENLVKISDLYVIVFLVLFYFIFIYLKYYYKIFNKIVICKHCLNSFDIIRDWQCPYCNKENKQRPIVFKCKKCRDILPAYKCPVCGEIIKFDDEYNEDELKKKRYKMIAEEKNE